MSELISEASKFAIDEVLRLRSELAQAKADHACAEDRLDKAIDEGRALKADNERLRAALKECQNRYRTRFDTAFEDQVREALATPSPVAPKEPLP